MTNPGDPGGILFYSPVNDARPIRGWGEGVMHLEPGCLEYLGHDFGSLPGANEWAGDNQVELNADIPHVFHEPLEPLSALLGQGTGMVIEIRAGIFRPGMPDDVQLCGQCYHE